MEVFKILFVIWDWVFEPVAGAGWFSSDTTTIQDLLVGWRLLKLYLVPFPFAWLYDRYTGYFGDDDHWVALWLWPLSIIFGIIAFIFSTAWTQVVVRARDGILAAFDYLVGMITRRVVMEDNLGRIYYQRLPRRADEHRRYRVGYFLEVQDHTGKHSIRIDPALMEQGDLTVRRAIAWTFNVEPNVYYPQVES